MLSLRQLDRLITAGALPRMKISANRTGIPRKVFETYLATRPIYVPSIPRGKNDGESAANYYALIIQTTMSRNDLVTIASRLGLPGAISAREHERPDRLWLMWHNALGYEPRHLLATIARSELNIVPSIPQ